MSAVHDCCAVIYISFHIHNAGDFVQVPIDGVHGQAKHKD